MDEVAEVRSFNRFYTAHVGALDDAYLGSPYGLTEARVLFELARDDTTEPGVVADSLGLDPSYLSRILARFEADGLVERRRAAHDARRRVLRLTADGRARGEELDRRSSDSVRRVLGSVSDTDRARLLEAMRTVRAVLTATEPAESNEPADESGHSRPVLRDPLPGDLGWVVCRNGELYAEEYGWDQTYEGLVARIVGEFGGGHDPDTERGWVATLDGERVGFVMCVRDDHPAESGSGESGSGESGPTGSGPGSAPPTVARLRLLFVDPAARGQGVGTALVNECIRFARAAGYDRITLWTNDPLTAARRIYDRAGFRLVSEKRHTSFGHTMTGQEMELDL